MSIRQAIRNAYLTSSVEEMEQQIEFRKERKDTEAVKALQEMIDECKKHNVDNFGKTPL